MKLRITVQGQVYDVDVEVLDPTGAIAPAAPAHVERKSTRATAPPPPAAAPVGPANPADKSIKAPIAGTVVQVKVKVGDAVGVNQVLVVMEAMKMETNISSPVAGKIKTVLCAPGKAVKAGEALVELE